MIAIGAGAFIFFGRGEKALDAETIESASDDDKALEPSASEPAVDAAEYPEEKIVDADEDEDEAEAEDNKAQEPGEKSAEDLNGQKNPKLRENMRSQVNTGIKRVYGDLYENLQLSSAEEEKITYLLAEQAMSAMEMTMSLFKKGNVSPEERNNKLKEITAIKENSNRAIKSMLGDEKYAKFEHYEKTRGQRQYVKSFAAKADTAGAKISRDMQNRLTDIMHEEQTKSAVLKEIMDPNTWDPSKLNKETMQKIAEEREKINTQILSRVKRELSAEQFEIFKSMQR